MLRPPMVSEAWFDFATRGAAQPLVDDSVSTEQQSWNISSPSLVAFADYSDY